MENMLSDYLQTVKALSENIDNTLKTITEYMDGDITERYKERLYNAWKQGETDFGNPIGRYQFPSGKYSREKHRQNPLAGLGNVDLLYTHRLFDSLIYDVKRNIFKSNVPYMYWLKGQYGAEPFMLNPQNTDDDVLQKEVDTMFENLSKLYK